MTAAKADTNDANPTATASYLTANYTSLGTANGGPLRTGLLTFGNSGATPQNVLTFEFSTRNDKALFLRGASDYICIGGSSSETPPTGAKVYLEIETEEDNL